jgi:hypothetical protein
MTGLVSTSKKSLERRWSSRCFVPVSTDESWMVASARESAALSATTSEPSNSRNTPRTLLIRCRTVKEISEWVGSMTQVPGSRPVLVSAVRVVMGVLPVSR